MVSPSIFLVALLPWAASANKPAFIIGPNPPPLSRAPTTQRHVSMPIDPFGPLVQEEKKKKEPAKEVEQAQEEDGPSGMFLSSVMAVNALLLGSLVLMATLAPTPTQVDQTITPTAGPRDQVPTSVEATNREQYEQNLAAEQVTYMSGSDMFFFSD